MSMRKAVYNIRAVSRARIVCCYKRITKAIKFCITGLAHLFAFLRNSSPPSRNFFSVLGTRELSTDIATMSPPCFSWTPRCWGPPFLFTNCTNLKRKFVIIHFIVEVRVDLFFLVPFYRNVYR